MHGVIFDMDGVLVDSYDAHRESWVRMAREIGRDLTAEQFHRTFGRTSREIIAEHWGQDALTPEEITAFDQRKEGLYREIVAVNFPAMDGAAELIRDLHAHGFRLAVGSSGPPENIALTLDRLGAKDLFHAVVNGRDVTNGKPDPQVFLLAAERLGVPPKHCAVIEDAPVGIQAANRAGMFSIALLSTGHTPEDAREAKRVCRSLRELSAEILLRDIGAG